MNKPVFLILFLLFVSLAGANDDAFQTLPGRWSGTMTVDGREVEVTELKISAVTTCDICNTNALQLDFVFKDAEFSLPIPRVFGFGPRLGKNSLFVNEAVHGSACVFPTSEFVFERQDAENESKRHYEIVLYKGEAPGPRVSLVYTLEKKQLEGSISDDGKKRAEFSFSRGEVPEIEPAKQ